MPHEFQFHPNVPLVYEWLSHGPGHVVRGTRASPHIFGAPPINRDSFSPKRVCCLVQHYSWLLISPKDNWLYRMAASQRWNFKECIAMVLKALAIFQMLQITMVSSEGLPRGRRTPGWSIRDDPEVVNRMMIKKRDDTPTSDGTPTAETTPATVWPKRTMAIDEASCSSKASYLANAMDTIQNMVRQPIPPIYRAAFKTWTNCALLAPIRQEWHRNHTKQFWHREVRMV